MSIADHSFLLVRPGDIVVVEENDLILEVEGSNWWVGHVIHTVGGARDPCVCSLLQVVCVDTGRIRIVNADVVKGILTSKGLD